MKWISVKERLPEKLYNEGDTYKSFEVAQEFIVNSEQGVVAGIWQNDVWYESQYSCCDIGDPQLYKVTHWMELPDEPTD